MDTVAKPAPQRGGKRPGAGRKRKHPLPPAKDFDHTLFDHDGELRLAECGRLLIAAGRALLGREPDRLPVSAPGRGEGEAGNE